MGYVVTKVRRQGHNNRAGPELATARAMGVHSVRCVETRPYVRTYQAKAQSRTTLEWPAKTHPWIRFLA
jgi:hypothetical protein